MKKVVLIIFLLFFSLMQGFTLEEEGEELKLILGEAKILAASSPTRIVIGNPNIADVTSVTRNEIIVSPKAAGSTTLVFWDNFGEQSFKIKVMTEDMEEVKSRVDNLLAKLKLANVYTKAEDAEGKVLLLGEVKNPQERERISQALGQLKDKTLDLIEVKEEEASVEIDVQVLELNKDATNTLGFSLPGSITLTDSSGATFFDQTGIKNIFRVTDFTRTAFNITLDALVQEGKVKVLSRPKLACQSGKEAELSVGGEKPIFTTQISSGGAGTSVEYKEFGIKLKIKPTVTEEERIKLALSVEVSEVGTAEFIGSSSNRTAQAYPLSKRTASTELYLNDGQTMAIGGLMKQKKEEDIRKTPVAGDIPILGMLFRKKTTRIGGGQGERGDSELFITLTTTIVSREKPKNKRVLTKQIPEMQEQYLSTKDIPPNLVNYVKAIQAKILKAIYYPRQAKDAGWEGNVSLSLNVNSNGNLKDIKISQSSGYKILDDAALEVARALSPYPPFPPQIESQELWVEVPIVYKKN